MSAPENILRYRADRAASPCGTYNETTRSLSKRFDGGGLQGTVTTLLLTPITFKAGQ
jgi:hypothetical protein